jgi:YgiT-type zinc finger domain-containing protein
MGRRLEDEEGQSMKCRVCGSKLHAVTTDLPFKLRERTIVIVKSLPVLQCERCSEYLLAVEVFARVEEMLSRVDHSAELEIVPFAA